MYASACPGLTKDHQRRVCTHLRVETRPAFDTRPALTEVTERLTFGATPPLSECSACNGEVKVFSDGAQITVFEANGKFYRNLESRAVLMGVPHSFRNPAVFLKDLDVHNRIQAEREVEALLRPHLQEQQHTRVRCQETHTSICHVEHVSWLHHRCWKRVQKRRAQRNGVLGSVRGSGGNGGGDPLAPRSTAVGEVQWRCCVSLF